MKTKKKYEKPSMEVYELQQQPQLLQASSRSTVQDYNVETTTQEW